MSESTSTPTSVPTLESFIHSIKSAKIYEYMHLKIFVNEEDKEDFSLKRTYEEAAKQHNLSIINEPTSYNSGFDIYLPDELKTTKRYANKVDYKIKCSATLNITDKHKDRSFRSQNSAFYMYGRSSISKSDFRLANNQGIVDMGYRGSLIGMFDLATEHMGIASRGERLLQICPTNLNIPMFIEVVNTFEDLGSPTTRGEKGLGSSGK